LFTEVILPGRIVPLLEQKGGKRLDPAVLDKALASTAERVRSIVMGLEVLNAHTLGLRIPGPEYLELLLTTDYLYFNALQGEQSSMRYAVRGGDTVAGTLNTLLRSYGLSSEDELAPLAEHFKGVLPREARGRDELLPEWLQRLTHEPAESGA
jgi:hypothetical protein